MKNKPKTKSQKRYEEVQSVKELIQACLEDNQVDFADGMTAMTYIVIDTIEAAYKDGIHIPAKKMKEEMERIIENGTE